MSVRSVTVEIQGRVLTVNSTVRLSRLDNNTKMSYNARSAVTGMSAASRRRLITLVNRLDVTRLETYMLTLTYTAEYPTPAESKRDLKVFLQRFRRLCPGAAGVWRLELQSRGAPHYHILLWKLPYVPHGTYQTAWSTVIGAHRARVRIERERSGALGRYVSKYVTKRDGPEDASDVRQAVSLSVSHTRPPEITGRWWGTLNRAGLPWGKIKTMTADYGKWFHVLKAEAKEVYNGIDADDMLGFQLYLDDPEQFLNESGSRDFSGVMGQCVD